MLHRPQKEGVFTQIHLHRYSSLIGVLGLALLAAFFAYVLTFAQVGFPLLKAVEFAFLSVISACIPGAVAWWIVRRIQWTAPTLQAALHLPLSLGFSWVWYFVSRLMGAGLDVVRGHDWVISWLPVNAVAWQLTQGLSVYAAIVAAAYAVGTVAEKGHSEQIDHGATGPVIVAAGPRATRFLAKTGDGFASIDINDIVLVEGADDYSEVTVVSGERRLVRLSLKAFEAQLGSTNFVRVHRSILIALDRLVSAEPAGGGRMLLYLPGGRVVRTSREGARKLRSRMI